MKISRFILILGLISLFSCTPKKAKPNIISEERFIRFFADYLIVQDENSYASLDSVHSKVRFDSLYQVHKLTPAEVESARVEYNKDLAKWQSIYEKTIARIESLQQAYKHAPPPAHSP